MGQPPAYIFVVRHGTRLDVADTKWHLTSPTPYDSPLTYGGWLQAKSVGVRIASILAQKSSHRSSSRRSSFSLPRPVSASSDRAQDGREATQGEIPSQQARQFCVIVHSSPYLRCVQTSIGICSGLAQFSSGAERSGLPVRGRTKFHRSLLRLDSFLGEWLTPDYFEYTIPPPAGGVILEKAKTDLLRRSDYYSDTRISVPAARNRHQIATPSSRWDGIMSTSLPCELEPSGLDVNHGSVHQTSLLELSGLPQDDENYIYAPPTPLYVASHNGKIPEGLVEHAKDACVTIDYQWDSSREPLDFGDSATYGEDWAIMHRRFRKGLQSLVDWYAATPDAAEPFSIATSLLTSQAGIHKGVGLDIGSITAEDLIEFEPEYVVENVVIIVSHGAGCNAIIGAITDQPALVDVSPASLTMAALQPVSLDSDGVPDLEGLAAPSASVQPKIPMHQLYDIKLLANTDHLRPAGALSSVSPHSGSHRGANWGAAPNGRSRNSSMVHPSPIIKSFRFGELASSLNGTVQSASHPQTAPVSIHGLTQGGHRRSSFGSHHVRVPKMKSTANSSVSSSINFDGLNPPPSKVAGLWSPTIGSSLRLSVDELEEDPNDLFPDFDHKKKFFNAPLEPSLLSEGFGDHVEQYQSFGVKVEDGPHRQRERNNTTRSAPIPIPIRPSMSAHGNENTSTQLGSGAGGLWGSFPAQTSGKRRWTVNDSMIDRPDLPRC